MRKLKTIEMRRLSLEQFREAEKLPLVVVLDNVRSLYNVGSVFRTCDASRVEAVYLCGITATPPNAEIHKTALGGEDSVDWRYPEHTENAVRELRNRGYFVYGVEQVEGSTKLQDIQNSQLGNMGKDSHDVNDINPSKLEYSAFRPHAVVFGNEVKGVKQSVVDMCDGCLEIPQFGTKHSLNVSVTAGIVIWEFAKLFIKEA